MNRPALSATPRLVLATLVSATSFSETAAAPLDLATLRAEHPRLLLTVERENALRERAPRDPRLAELLTLLRASADRALGEPVVEHRLVGPRLLAQSRACLAKVATLALAYRLHGDERHAERAWRELEAALAFPDWNPSHFLDTAELCAAVALGYDWLHGWLGPERRARLREALVAKGLEPGRTPGARAAAAKQNNWNPVCHGGLLLAALAIADEEPRWAAELLPRVVADLPKALQHYAPDGAWYEGPGYWKYGTTYLAMLLDALDTALGHDGGLGDAPGLARTGDFFRQSIGPSGQFFNYADSGTEPGSSPTLFWLAHRHQQPALADLEHALLRRVAAQRRARAAARAPSARDEQALKLGDSDLSDPLYGNRFFALELAWYHPGTAEPAGLTAAAASTAFRGVTDVAYLRAGPGTDAFFVGIKGAGRPNAHAHLDAGAFVLDALGVRWAAELGPDNYDLPGYWEMADAGRRWTYFRLGSASHNIVTINGRNQRAGIHAPLTAFLAGRDRSHARYDLSAAYAGDAASAHRGVALVDGQGVLVQDEIAALRAGDEARWALLTFAEIALRGDVAVLTLQGRSLHARLLAPAGARWALEATQPPTPTENPNTGTRLLTARAPLGPESVTTFAVWLTPADTPAPRLEPLSAWPDGR